MSTSHSSHHTANRLARITCAGLLAVVCAGCATQQVGGQRYGTNPRDPLEGWNRGAFAFNADLDRVVFVPLATAYRELTPQMVRTGVGNFFGNLEDVWSFVNSVLQAKATPAASSFFRVAVNTTMGLGGLLDVASEMGLERQREDFGQTLGWWGVGSGPYLVLPFFGSSTLRDTLSMPVDWAGDVIGNTADTSTRNTLKAIDLLDTRAGLLRAGAVIDEAALDRYTFTRDAYLQRRASLVFDGNPPPSEADTDGGAR